MPHSCARANGRSVHVVPPRYRHGVILGSAVTKWRERTQNRARTETTASAALTVALQALVG
jgi:hypothetical protein